MIARLLSALLCALAPVLSAQNDNAAAGRIDPKGVPGARILGGGGRLPDGIYERFLELAGGEAAKIVLIPTASSRCDTPEGQQRILARWQEAHPGYEFTLLHTRDRGTADSAAFTAPLRAATGVWIGGGQQRRLAVAYVGTRVETELQDLLARGGVVGGSSAGTAIQTKTMIQSGMNPPVIATGLDLVPNAISDQHFLKRERLPRLRLALATHAGLFGIGVDEGTALEIRGRQMRVHGKSKVLLVLPPGGGRAERIVELTAGQRADLVTWQRAARDRTRSPWPGKPMATPSVVSGSLVIVGGGAIDAAIVDRFVELAGGKDAVIVFVPSASPRRGERRLPLRKQFEQRSARVMVLDCAHPDEVTDEALAVLDDATGIWFGGGRQWRLVDAFEGTKAIAAMRAVLRRGGAIGGSSAGATIQGEFLVRGNPLGNTDEWCEGYDRGFGFLPGCAIDQHFIARNREADLQQLIHELPELIGLGIDEGTAAIVRGGELEVLGRSKIAVFDVRSRAAASDAAPPEPVWLSPGERWDLPAGKRR